MRHKARKNRTICQRNLTLHQLRISGNLLANFNRSQTAQKKSMRMNTALSVMLTVMSQSVTLATRFCPYPNMRSIYRTFARSSQRSALSVLKNSPAASFHTTWTVARRRWGTLTWSPASSASRWCSRANWKITRLHTPSTRTWSNAS